MRSRNAQLSVTAVAFLLGLLVVVQLRSQVGLSGLEARSAQELTVLVANLTSRNDQLRREVATLEREVSDLTQAAARGESSIDRLRIDLARLRVWAGLDPVVGPGIRITVGGLLPGSAVEELINELRNAGAEAIAVGGVRIVPGSVVAGPPGAVSVENTALGDPFEIEAIGSPETLTGSLTRMGGIVAQLSARFPEATITVTPLDRLRLPATDRDLRPTHGTPTL
ncbi:MAG: hypothetical protein KatS3mg065_0420 [Chloroflexota bacterium]|nr:MAG: hypothetical protein KatS3mg065_0420 [Chloroflexota bacterium]